MLTISSVIRIVPAGPEIRMVTPGVVFSPIVNVSAEVNFI